MFSNSSSSSSSSINSKILSLKKLLSISTRFTATVGVARHTLVATTILGWGLMASSPGLTTCQRSKLRPPVCWTYSEDLCKGVANRLRHELTLPLSVPILKHVHLYGLLIRRVPRMIWRGCKGVPPDGYARSGTKWVVVGPKHNYEECRSQLRWPTVQQRHQLLSCCQTFKIIHNLDCLNFDDYLCFNRSPTRSHSLTLRCTRSRINSFRYSFFVNIPFLWNTIPYDIVNSTSYAAFKYKLKSFFN